MPWLCLIFTRDTVFPSVVSLATELPDGVISPGGVGYDINCGVRLLGTFLDEEDVAPYLDELVYSTATYLPHME